MSRFRETLAAHRVTTFCVITFALTWGFWLVTVYPLALPLLAQGENPLSGMVVTLFVGAGMLFPAIGVLVTRLLTGEGFKDSMIKPVQFRRTWKYYAIGWFGPIFLVTLGAGVFFLLNPGDFDPSMPNYITMVEEQMASAGQPNSMDVEQIRLTGYASMGLMFLAPVLNCIPCFGEEWGWRGYLLPKLREKHSDSFAIVASGIIWGLWHAPIIALGHNYGLGYPGWPILGIVAMCFFCVFAGAFFSWLTIRAGSCIPATLAHGAINGCAAGPAMFAVTATNPFIGPSPMGFIGGIGFILAAVFCMVSLRKHP